MKWSSTDSVAKHLDSLGIEYKTLLDMSVEDFEKQLNDWKIRKDVITKSISYFKHWKDNLKLQKNGPGTILDFDTDDSETLEDILDTDQLLDEADEDDENDILDNNENDDVVATQTNLEANKNRLENDTDSDNEDDGLIFESPEAGDEVQFVENIRFNSKITDAQLDLLLQMARESGSNYPENIITCSDIKEFLAWYYKSIDENIQILEKRALMKFDGKVMCLAPIEDFQQNASFLLNGLLLKPFNEDGIYIDALTIDTLTQRFLSMRSYYGCKNEIFVYDIQFSKVIEDLVGDDQKVNPFDRYEVPILDYYNSSEIITSRADLHAYQQSHPGTSDFFKRSRTVDLDKEYDLIILPLYINGNHFVLVFISKSKAKIYYIDQLYPANANPKIVQRYTEYFRQHVSETFMNMCEVRDYKIEALNSSNMDSMYHQSAKSNDCGIFLITRLFKLICFDNENFHVTQDSCYVLRRIFGALLYKDILNGEVPVRDVDKEIVEVMDE